MTIELIIRSILLGAGLAMDAFSVSLADGLNERVLSAKRVLTIAGTFAAFQFFMPALGWLLVRKAAETFETFRRYIPWIAFILLLYIGGKMLLEGIRDRRSGRGNKDEVSEGAPSLGEQPQGSGKTHETEVSKGSTLSAGDLFIQGVATSIDALSVGFTIASYTAITALSSSLIIGVVTLLICIAGLHLGRSIGTRLSGEASMLGGVILIAIGIEILIKGLVI